MSRGLVTSVTVSGDISLCCCSNRNQNVGRISLPRFRAGGGHQDLMSLRFQLQCLPSCVTLSKSLNLSEAGVPAHDTEMTVLCHPALDRTVRVTKALVPWGPL